MNETKAGSWWQTLPGVITAVATLLTAIGGLLVVLNQRSAAPDPAAQSEAAAAHSPASANPTTAGPAGPKAKALPEVRAGHYVFRLLEVKQEPQGTGLNATIVLRFTLRVTDAVGTSDYLDRLTFRLAADDAEQIAENSIHQAVSERQSVTVEAVFTIPADARHVELLVGRREDGTRSIPIDLRAR